MKKEKFNHMPKEYTLKEKMSIINQEILIRQRVHLRMLANYCYSVEYYNGNEEYKNWLGERVKEIVVTHMPHLTIEDDVYVVSKNDDQLFEKTFDIQIVKEGA